MASIFVGDFGEINGVRTYRVNGEKADLIRVINEIRELDALFVHEPVLEEIRFGQWTMLLQIKLPVEVGANDQDT